MGPPTWIDNLKDWKTTIPATIAALASFVVFQPDLFPVMMVAWAKWVGLGGMVVFGVNANGK